MWHPRHLHLIMEWPRLQTVADDLQPGLIQNGNRLFVERMVRGHPHLRCDRLAVHDREAGREALPLVSGEPSELAPRVDPDDPTLFGEGYVLVAVHADRPASRLPLANAVPEVPSRIINLAGRIPIVRYDREDRPDRAEDGRVFDLIQTRQFIVGQRSSNRSRYSVAIAIFTMVLRLPLDRGTRGSAARSP